MGQRQQYVAAATRGNGPRRRRATAGAGRARRRRWLRRGLALGLLGAELAALSAVVLSVRSGLAQGDASPTPTPARSVVVVAGHPHRYGGRTISVTGRVGARPRQRSARDRWAFLLMGGRRSRLLVVPASGHDMVVFRTGTHVTVHGRVTVPRRHHLKQLARTSRARVAARSHARAIVEADYVTARR